MSQSTISRHIQALEHQAGSPLLIRETPVGLTQRGASLLAAVRPMVDHALAARSALETAPEISGEVVVTTVGELLRWHLVPRLPELFLSHPGLRLRLLADNQLHSLAAGEADVALRFARPEAGDLISRPLRTITYAYCAPASLEVDGEAPWLGLTGSLATIPEQRHAERMLGRRPPRLLVEDLESLGLAVQAGMGVAVLPRELASRLSGVVEVPGARLGLDGTDPIPTRQLWMVAHRSRQRIPKVQAVMRWLEQTHSIHDPPTNPRASG